MMVEQLEDLHVSDWYIYTGVTTDNDRTLLQSACIGGHKEAIQYLVEKLNCDLGECATRVNLSNDTQYRRKGYIFAPEIFRLLNFHCG